MCLVDGCAAMRRAKPGANLPVTSLSQLRADHPDLQSARFDVIADFEKSSDAAAFEVAAGGASGSNSAAIPTIVREDNGHCLRTELAPGQRLVLRSGVAGHLLLPSDWTGQTLLLVSVRVEGDAGRVLQMQVRSAGTSELTWTSQATLAPGWNRLRFDLAELRDRVDLARIESIGWSWAGAGGTSPLMLDQLALANNTVSAVSSNTELGRFQVVTRGRRAVVGVQGEFDLEFGDGMIMSWRDQDGPNLAPPAGLGPLWVSLASADSVPPAPRPAAPRIVEASGFRAVIDFPDDASQTRYAVYPDGSIYVASSANGDADATGCQIRVLNRSGFQPVDPPQHSAASPGAPFALLSQDEPKQPDLLWCLRDASGASQPRVAAPRADILSATAGPLSGRVAQMLRVLPRDIDGAGAGSRLASAYLQPGAVHVSNGAVVTTQPGDLDHDGFNESEGLYELAHAEGILRARFDPGRVPRTNARFRLADTAGKRCWAVANGRILATVGRDAQGNLLFELPGATESQVTLEVTVGQ